MALSWPQARNKIEFSEISELDKLDKFKKQLAGMFSKAVPNFILDKERQPVKAQVLVVVPGKVANPLPIVTVVNCVQLANELFPIVLTLFGISKLVKPVF